MKQTRTTQTALFGIAVIALLSASAGARSPVVLQITNGNNAGPPGDNQGPGAEQPTVVQSLMNGKRYITTVWMSSQVQAQGDANYQCKCSTVELDPLSGPHMVVPPTQITDNNGGGDRPCNHPHMDINPLTNQILWSYATDDANGNNVQPYVQGLDVMCNVTTDRVRIGNNNGNDGAPWAKVVNASSGLFQVGYLENNERSRAVGIEFAADGTITKLYNKTIVDPANIGRPSVERLSDTRTVFCSSNGDNRPPEIGVRCAEVDALTGDIIWSQVIAQSQPNGNPEYYMNQPVVALGENGRFYLQVEKSNGNNNNNNRGATTTLIYTMLPDETGPHTVGHVEGIGANQVHATTCTGKYGADNKLHAAIFDASITGSGFAQVQMAKFDVAGNTLANVESPKVLGGYPGDSGYLANIYGQNPNTQGRDFMRCIGDIPNPGFGVTGGFLPTVKSFFAFPFAGRVPGEDKNSLFLSMLPAEEPVPAAPVPHDLSVIVNGDGAGSVSSNPLGIDACTTGTCTGTFDDGLTITLSATANAGSTFIGWSGDCSGAGVCVVPMLGGRQVTATFTSGTIPVDPNDPVGLIVAVQGDGEGSVTSDPAGIDCDSGTCVNNFARNDSVTLTAHASKGSTFVGWIGDCSGTGACTLSMSVARNITATFNVDLTAPAKDVKKPGASAQGPVAKAGGCSSTSGSGSVFGLALLGLFLSKRRRVVGVVSSLIAGTVIAGCAVQPAALQPKIVSFAAKQPTVAANTPVELTYKVTDAEAVTVSIAGGADLLPYSELLEGSIFTPPLATSTTFLLTAYNQDRVANSTVSVTIGIPGTGGDDEEPVASHGAILVFSSSAADLVTGGTATLSWQTSGATGGVILANDAIASVVSAADVGAGSFDVTPSASSVYTLSVTGSDGQQVTSTTAITVSATGVSTATGEELFTSNVQGILQTKCGSCHQTGNASGYPDMLGTGPATYYARISGDVRFLTAIPEDSLLLLKGEHTGPAFLPAEAQKVTAWLVKEAAERGLGGGGGPTAPPGDFRPRSLAEALTRFGACMNRDTWDQTYGQGNNTKVANQGTNQGQCMACHTSGTGGAFLSASSGDTFDMNRIRPYVLKLVLGTANDDGSFKDLIPARRFELKGNEGGDHPSYVMTQERLDAMNSFVDQTLVSFRNYTQQCNNP